jgi:hypothetical protein
MLWSSFTIAEVSQKLVEAAGRFAAHELHTSSEQPVAFACYDRRLNQAAQLLQLEVLP